MAIRAAVIGAGLAGLSCAHGLRAAGWDVDVFEAADTIGGRFATMRLGHASFDCGAQYVSPRLAQFERYLADMTRKGYAALWKPRQAAATPETRGPAWYVGVPTMSAMLRPLAEGLRIHTRRPVHTLKRRGATWQVWFEDATSAGPFAAIAIAVPAPKALLITGGIEGFEARLTQVRMTPVWTLQAHLAGSVLADADIYGDVSDVVRWVARNNSKPRRQENTECLVVQASPAWSSQAQDDDPATVAEELWSELGRVLGIPAGQRPIAMRAHLWRHGFADKPLGETCIFSSRDMVGVAGDWCRGRLAEQAFDSGAALARSFIAAI